MGEPRQLLGVLFLIGGVGFMAYVWLRQKSVEASKSWPSVSGKITRSEVVRQSSVRQGSANTFYVAKIEYTYVVDGEIRAFDYLIGGVFAVVGFLMLQGMLFS